MAEATTTAEREVLFQRFEWVRLPSKCTRAERELAELAGLARDVACGVQLLTALAERDSIDGACADEHDKSLPALLSGSDHGCLERLSQASLQLLAQHAEAVIDRLQQPRH